MSELEEGDYQCDECGFGKHNPDSKVCPECGGEMVYMMTDVDALAARIAELEGALRKIIFLDLKPFEKELLHGADELKKIAQEVLK